MDEGEVLRVNDLRVAFDVNGSPVEVVKGIGFRVCQGAVTAVVGESGSGKSVTAQAIMQILPKNGSIVGGSIEFRPKDGAVVDMAKLPPNGPHVRSLRGSAVSMIFQEPMSSLSPVHTVGDQVEESLRIHALGKGLSRKELRAATEETLGLAGFPDPHRAYDMYPFEMSGGLRQRAMIAMALICRPALLIADEPTTALDVTVQAQILKLLKDLQAKFNMAVLLITHDLGVVANLADEVVVVYDGRVVEAGPVDEIFRDPQHEYLKALLNAAPHFDMAPDQRLVALRGGKRDMIEARKTEARREQPDSRPLLTVSNLSKIYHLRKASLFGGEARVLKAVDDVSFTIKRGECLGLVGESGSGKTTVSKILTRAITADSGSVVFDDGEKQVDVLALDNKELKAFRPHLQMVFQDPVSSLSPRMTIADILREPMQIHDQGNRAQQTARAKELLTAVELGHNALNRYPHSFSGGQRQRIGIARALAMNPDLLILDEPVSALDVSVQAQVLNLLKDLQKELGLTYLFIAHNLAVVNYMAERVAVMAAGRIVEIGPSRAIFEAPTHPYTRALLKAVPFADLDRPLVLDELVLKGSSDPGNWPEAFRGDMNDLAAVDLGGGHQVLARKTADFREFRA
ncbi:MAG: ABC transporter ATP-binding protein [Mesorhizobium sp.]|nr:ABC transporter ATP-binding protein [Mesorhizobium sp.]MBL8579454.1 ABC transporter ATP-binding protein [Mesorhizobium sp.]